MKNVATIKAEKKDLPRSVAFNTLGKVDDTVNLKKCTRAKDRGRKKRTGDTQNTSVSNNPNHQPHTKKAKVESRKVEEAVSEGNGKPAGTAAFTITEFGIRGAIPGR